MKTPKQEMPTWQDEAIDKIHSEISMRKMDQLVAEGDIANLSEFELMEISRHNAKVAKKERELFEARWKLGAKHRDEMIADAFEVSQYRMTPQEWMKKWG